jgi:hypothetical protein
MGGGAWGGGAGVERHSMPPPPSSEEGPEEGPVRYCPVCGVEVEVEVVVGASPCCVQCGRVIE